MRTALQNGALQGISHIGGGQHCTVMEFDTLADLEGIDQTIR